MPGPLRRRGGCRRRFLAHLVAQLEAAHDVIFQRRFERRRVVGVKRAQATIEVLDQRVEFLLVVFHRITIAGTVNTVSLSWRRQFLHRRLWGPCEGNDERQFKQGRIVDLRVRSRDMRPVDVVGIVVLASARRVRITGERMPSSNALVWHDFAG